MDSIITEMANVGLTLLFVGLAILVVNYIGSKM